jgi:hypothetical protein
MARPQCDTPLVLRKGTYQYPMLLGRGVLAQAKKKRKKKRVYLVSVHRLSTSFHFPINVFLKNKQTNKLYNWGWE